MPRTTSMASARSSCTLIDGRACYIILGRSCREPLRTVTRKELRKALFIGFFEYNADDADKVIEKFTRIMAERQTGSERFARRAFGPYHFDGEIKGWGCTRPTTWTSS